MLSSADHVLAKDYIDQEQLKYDMQFSELDKKLSIDCKSIRNFNEWSRCHDDARTKAREKFPARGTDEYAQRNYSGLNPSQAELVLIKLHDIYQNAEPRIDHELVPGRITTDDVRYEAVWIQHHIFKSPIEEREIQADPWLIPCTDLSNLEKNFHQIGVPMCKPGSGGHRSTGKGV